jgi:two-component system chemotaxis response regulator CheY
MPCSVLIADDNPLLRQFLRKIVARTPDFEVSGEAENGLIAIEKFKELHPEIVLLDLQMPVMDGLNAARQIKALEPRTTIVLFTMYDTELVRDVASVFGVDIVIPKSNGSGQLMAKLREICARNPRTDP